MTSSSAKNITLNPLKGFRDFLPPEARARQWLRARMITVFEKWGYEPLETPTVEPLDLFAGEIGEDEQLFYKFKDWGDRDVMLRYDQTAPTCRVVGCYSNDISFPFRRYQIQPAFRAEKPQRGRFREFTQVDLDIFGVAGPEADAEIIAATLNLYQTLGFPQAVALVNNRDLMSGIPYSAISSIDKLAKIGAAGVIADMVKKDIPESQARIYLDQVRNIQPDQTIDTIFTYLKNSGIPDTWYKFEPTLARSFSYSQGPIWEITIPGYDAGSVGGGERYDKLMQKISGQSIPGTGIGIGFDRTLEAAVQFKLVPDYTPASQILVTVFSPELFAKSQQLSTNIRQDGVAVELYPDPRIKLEKQLKYAARRNIPYVAILGPEEIENNQITIKDLRAGNQQTIPFSDFSVWSPS